MAQETTPKGPIRFTNRVQVFILVELVLGVIFMGGGGLLIYFERPFAGLAIMLVGVWLQLSVMLWRCISYQIAQLLEIAPSLKELNKLLGGKT